MSKSFEYFDSYFYYDSKSPSGLRWKVDRPSGRKLATTNVSKGDVAGCKNQGYWHVGLEGGDYGVHNIVWTLLSQEPPFTYIDHIDGNGENNTFSNLRETTHAINCRNKGMYSSNSTGVTGVCFKVTNPPYNHTIVVAQCRSLDGKVMSRSFSVKKYGLMPAFKMACDWRYSTIGHLNILGAGYTDRHRL